MLFSMKLQPKDWRPATLSKNVCQRCLAENFPNLKKSCLAELMQKNVC